MRKIQISEISVMIFVLVSVSLFSPSLSRSQSAAVPPIQEKDLKEPSVTESRPQGAPESQSSIQGEQKGGIYKVGRVFKSAGRGIKKGFFATGRAFQKVGSSIKGAFVGERPSDQGTHTNQTNQKPNLDHVGDEPESQPSS